MESYSPCHSDHFQLFFFALSQLLMKIWHIFICIVFGLLHWAASVWYQIYGYANFIARSSPCWCRGPHILYEEVPYGILEIPCGKSTYTIWGAKHRVYLVDTRYIENRPAARTGACRKSRLGVLPTVHVRFLLVLLYLGIYSKLYFLIWRIPFDQNYN